MGKPPQHMHIIFDERESALLAQCTARNTVGHHTLVHQVIPLGDIVIQRTADDATPLLIIERKTLADLLASIQDGRYQEQSHRLIHASGIPAHNILYVIEGVLQTSPKKALIYATMTSLNVFKGFSVFRTSHLNETAEWVLAVATKMARELDKGTPMAYGFVAQEEGGANPNPLSVPVPVPPPAYTEVVKKVKKDNVTPDNMLEIMLCQVPGISSTMSAVLVKQYPTMRALLAELADPTTIDGLTYDCHGKTKRVSKTVIANLRTYLQ